jgi:hypothetical protein
MDLRRRFARSAWFIANYGDDNARVLLGTILTAAILETDEWDEAILRGIRANFRTTGKLGFRGQRIDMPALEQNGWKHYADAETVFYSPHFESYMWACYLWAYDKTGYAPFLEKTRGAIRMMMEGYPDKWLWGFMKRLLQQAILSLNMGMTVWRSSCAASRQDPRHCLI